MTLKFEIEVDLTDAILNNDSHPFEDFTTRDYEQYIRTELREKMDEIQLNCGAEIKIKDEEGKTVC